LGRFFNIIYWVLHRIRKKVIYEKDARQFSNRILKNYLPCFSGDIINVSGCEDADKNGDYYRNYYKCWRRYVISNIGGVHGTAINVPEAIELIYLDLEEPIKTNLFQKFDVVFTHTVLEHIYNFPQALQNLVDLSRDVIVIVIPFVQSVHYTESYNDYVRLTPHYLKKYFENKGFTVLLSTANGQPFSDVYVVFIVTRYPDKHKKLFMNAPICMDIQIKPSRWGKLGNNILDRM